MITIVVALNDDFIGGAFGTNEADEGFLGHPLSTGDGVVFVSHKYHSVQPVIRGVRRRLVVEHAVG